MPRTTRAIVQVCVSLFAAAGLLHAASQSAQSGPPPVSAQQEPATTPVRPPPTPEMRALQDANRIQDRAQKLEALRKVRADFANSRPVVLRQLDEVILWHLVAQFPERRDDIVRAFEQVLASVPLTPAEPRLLGVTTLVARLLDNKVVLEQAEPPLKDALAASPVPGIAGRSEATRGRALEALGRLHLAQGQVDLAARELGEALELSPMLAHAPIALAELDVKRGNKTAALDRYQLAAISGRMKVADEAALRTLYREVHGSDANLEADLDRLYDKRFPNPITPKRYEPPTTGVKRIVLVELFTGSACAPCVSADLSWDALLERYPDSVIAPIAYHAHIPGPDPMVVPGADGRRLYYQVKGVPTFNVNGALGRLGGGARENATRTYESYIASIDRALATAPAADVQVQATRTGSQITVTAKASSLPPNASDLRFHVVLAERQLAFSGENGIRHHAMVVRAVAGDKGAGIPIPGSSDATVDHTFDLSQIKTDVETTVADEIARRRKTQNAALTPPDYRADGRAMGTINPDALVVVAFVQDASKNVLQAARVNVK